VSNLDVNKGDFSKLDDTDKADDDAAADLSDLGSDFSDSLDLEEGDDEEGENAENGDGGDGDDDVATSSVTKSTKTGTKKSSTVSGSHRKGDGEGSEVTDADKASVLSAERAEEFDKDHEAYKPKNDED